MTHCPRCDKEIASIQHSTYGGTITFYHKCHDIYALIREDGTVATNDLAEILTYQLKELNEASLR